MTHTANERPTASAYRLTHMRAIHDTHHTRFYQLGKNNNNKTSLGYLGVDGASARNKKNCYNNACIVYTYLYIRYINLCIESQHPLWFDLYIWQLFIFQISYLEAMHL